MSKEKSKDSCHCQREGERSELSKQYTIIISHHYQSQHFLILFQMSLKTRSWYRVLTQTCSNLCEKVWDCSTHIAYESHSLKVGLDTFCLGSSSPLESTSNHQTCMHTRFHALTILFLLVRSFYSLNSLKSIKKEQQHA